MIIFFFSYFFYIIKMIINVINMFDQIIRLFDRLKIKIEYITIIILRYLKIGLDLIYQYQLNIILTFTVMIFSFNISNMMKEKILNEESKSLNNVNSKRSQMISSSKKNDIVEIKNQNNTKEVFLLLNKIYQYQHKTTWIDDFKFDKKSGINFSIYSIDIDGLEEYIEHLINSLDESYIIKSYDIKKESNTLINKVNMQDKKKVASIRRYAKKIHKNEMQSINSPMFDSILLKNVYKTKIIISKAKT